MFLTLILVSACSDDTQLVEDERCEDPHIGSVEPDWLWSGFVDFEPEADGVMPAREGLCDGSSEIKLVAMERFGAGTFQDFYVLHRYRGAFFLIDGRCHFYAFSYGIPRLKIGIVTAEMLAQLTADLRLDSLPDLPSSKDTLSPHYTDSLLATTTHSLRCRDAQCRTPEATAAIEQASSWIAKLSAQGQPASGELTAFAFPDVVPPPASDPEDTATPGPLLQWPLKPTLRSLRKLVVTDIYPTGGLGLTDEPAASLRKLRSEAIEASGSDRSSEPTATKVSDCGQTYRLLMRDELPYRHHGDFLRFLETAWARPVIPSCFPGPPATAEVTPCPDDDE